MADLMKGHTWKDRSNAVKRDGSHVVTYPVMVESKHDEIRVQVIVNGGVTFLSYAGKPLYNLERFAPMFFELAKYTGLFEFDMGFEVDGSFDKSNSWTKQSKGLKPELQDLPVKWYLFGLPSMGGTLKEQWDARWKIYTGNLNNRWNICLPTMMWAYDNEGVFRIYAAYRRAGYEGAMAKQPDHLYERKRTDGWLKVKPSEDADGVIVGFTEAVAGVDQPELGIKIGDPLGRIGSVTLRMEDGSEASPHGINHDLGRDMYLHPEKYLGQWVEFQYMERDRQGGYRHPTFHRFREAKA